METVHRIREPKVGMKVVSTSPNCCAGMDKGEVGYIMVIKADELSFKVNDGSHHCVKCVMELRETSKADWFKMCDKEDNRRLKSANRNI